MLHVEIEVPALEKRYEFGLNENMKIRVIIEEVAAIIGQHEEKKWDLNDSPLILCCCGTGQILPEGRTLYECQVQPGSRLLLL